MLLKWYFALTGGLPRFEYKETCRHDMSGRAVGRNLRIRTDQFRYASVDFVAFCESNSPLSSLIQLCFQPAMMCLQRPCQRNFVFHAYVQ